MSVVKTVVLVITCGADINVAIANGSFLVSFFEQCNMRRLRRRCLGDSAQVFDLAPRNNMIAFYFFVGVRELATGAQTPSCPDGPCRGGKPAQWPGPRGPATSAGAAACCGSWGWQAWVCPARVHRHTQRRANHPIGLTGNALCRVCGVSTQVGRLWRCILGCEPMGVGIPRAGGRVQRGATNEGKRPPDGEMAGAGDVADGDEERREVRIRQREAPDRRRACEACTPSVRPCVVCERWRSRQVAKRGGGITRKRLHRFLRFSGHVFVLWGT